MLVRWRHFDTYQRSGVEFKAHSSTITRLCYQVQQALTPSRQFILTGFDQNITNDSNTVIQLAVDATECQIERPLNESQKEKKRQNKQQSNA